jgi:hypothetical protein
MERLTMQAMHRRRLLWLLGTLAALLSVLLMVQLFSEWIEDQTLEARFNKIRPGMTIKEVENLVGPHFDSWPSGTDGVTGMTWCFPGPSPPSNYVGPHCAFDVWFDASGKVINKQLNEGNLKSKGTFKDWINEFLRKIGL